jgi:hypothetical protein
VPGIVRILLLLKLSTNIDFASSKLEGISFNSLYDKSFFYLIENIILLHLISNKITQESHFPLLS